MVKFNAPNLRWSFIILIAGLCGAVALGVYLRIVNQSDYILYPDGYVNLIIAKALVAHHQVTQSIGSAQETYPGVFFWTRPLTPLALGGVAGLFNIGFITASQALNIGAFLVSLLLIFFHAKKLYQSAQWAAVAVLAFSLSASHSVWSGYVSTEPLAILTVTLVLTVAAVFDYRRWYMAAGLGASLALAILCRYEYAALLLPLAVHARLKYPKTAPKITLLIGGVAYGLGLLAMGLLIRGYGFDLIQFGGLLLFGLGIAVLVSARFSQPQARQMWWILGAFGVLLIGLSSGFRTYLMLDAALVFAGALGLIRFIKSYQRPEVWLYLTAIVALSAVYMLVSRDNFRYWTSFVPVLSLLVPAGIMVIFARLRKTLAVFATLGLLAAQVTAAYNGISKWSHGIFLKKGYDQTSAQTLRRLIPAHATLVVAQPEPYSLFTDKPILGVFATQPFVDHADLKRLGTEQVVVIQDAGMHVLFPEFSTWIDKNLGDSQTATYKVKQPFLYGSRVYAQYKQVKVYVLPANQLAERLSK